MYSFPDNMNLSGFGSHTGQEVMELQKALSIGSEYATTVPGQLTQGAALAVEDLDRTLKLVTFSLNHIKLWKDIIKDRAIQTVHEFNIQNEYGQTVSPFFNMGGVPTETDAGYNRDVAIVKYLGTQGQVQHNLTLIQAAHGPIVAREVKNKTIQLIGQNEFAMFTANSNINPLEYDGVDYQIKSKQNQAKYVSGEFQGYATNGISDSVVLDLRGAIMDEDVNEEAALIALNNFGQPLDMYLSPNVLSVFSRSFYAKERVRPGDSTAAGYYIKEHMGSLNFRFKANQFNRPRRTALVSSTASEAAPTLSSLTVASDPNSQFGVANVANGTNDTGTFFYQISAFYADGETLPSAQQSISVAAGQSVSGSITFLGTPLYFNVFRGIAPGNSTDLEFIGRVGLPLSGSGGSILLDENLNLPGLASAYLLMHDPDTLIFKQLGSMIKYDLAVIDTSYRWLQLLYGTLVIAAPRKHVIMNNISSPNSLSQATPY